MPDLVNGGQALEWVLDKIAAASKKKGATKPAPYVAPKLEPPKLYAFKPAEKITGDRKKKEVDLWHQWNNNGRKPKDLDPLLHTFNNLIQTRKNAFRGAEIPSSALEFHLKTLALDAFRSWDPKRGGALNTWLQHKLKPGQRFVDSHKSPTYSPENITKHIGSYNVLKAELTEKLGHEPDANSIHDHILEFGHPRSSFAKLSLRDIKRLEKEQRRSLISSGKDTDDTSGVPNLSSRAEEVKLLIAPELTKEELIVHELSFGLNGKPQLKPGDIAKRLKFDNSKVAKLRTSILKKMQKYMGPDNG